MRPLADFHLDFMWAYIHVLERYFAAKIWLAHFYARTLHLKRTRIWPKLFGLFSYYIIALSLDFLLIFKGIPLDYLVVMLFHPHPDHFDR